MKHYLKTMESALAYIEAMPEDIDEAEVFTARDITYRGRPVSPDVVEDMLFQAVMSRAKLFPARRAVCEDLGRTYSYARNPGQPPRSDA
jgi:hypothetical protein